jgi:hypothetical protein
MHFLVTGLLTLVPLHGHAQASSDDLSKLQAQVDAYVSAAMTSEIDSLMSSYDAMKIGQTYSANSPTLGPVQDGNADSTWTKMTYTNMSASQLIGYASDLCASHPVSSQLVAKGVKVDEAKFNSVRDKFCKLVKAAAELKHRYDKYQSIKKNGITLVKRARSEGHDFKGRHRTFGVGLDLVYKPDIANTLESGIHPDQTFQYNSWIKWSDDNPTPLNIIKKIREMRNADAGSCNGFSFHVIDGKEVDGWFYIDVANVTSSKVTIKNCAKVDYNNTHKTHGFPEFTMEAPFGYLYELEQMKDSAKAKLVDQIKNKVVSMVGANQQMIELLKKLQ